MEKIRSSRGRRTHPPKPLKTDLETNSRICVYPQLNSFTSGQGFAGSLDRSGRSWFQRVAF